MFSWLRRLLGKSEPQQYDSNMYSMLVATRCFELNTHVTGHVNDDQTLSVRFTLVGEAEETEERYTPHGRLLEVRKGGKVVNRAGPNHRHPLSSV